jgi:lipopolysaccharide transport system permease protein
MSEAQSIEPVASASGLWRQIRYLYYLTDHRIRQQNKSYALGFLWWILDPIINTGILYVVKTLILPSKTPNLALFLLTGLLMYRFVQTAITNANQSLLQAMTLSSRLYVPKSVFVIRDVASQFIQFLIGLVFIMVMVIAFGDPHIKPLQLLYVLFVAVMFSLAASSLVAGASIVVRDLRVVLGYVFRALFFLSGIFYTIERVPEEWRSAFLANPFALLIQQLRVAILTPDPLDYVRLTILLGVSLLLGAAGFYFLWKYDRVLTKYAS